MVSVEFNDYTEWGISLQRPIADPIVISAALGMYDGVKLFAFNKVPEPEVPHKTEL